MKQKLTTMLPFLILLALDFYLAPWLIRDTGTAMLAMLLAMPLAAFLTALAYGLRQGFWLLFPLAAAVLFLPSVPLYYNSSAWGYALFYGGTVLAGMALGRAVHGRR